MRDLRLPLLATAAWVGALMGAAAPRAPVPATLAAALVAVVFAAAWRHPGARATALTALAVLLVVLASTLVRDEQLRHGPLVALASRRDVAAMTGTVVSDPRTITGPFGDMTLVRVNVRAVESGGVRTVLRSTVLVRGDAAWRKATLGETVRVTGRLLPASEGDVAAMVAPRTAPVTLAGPGVGWRVANAVRASIRRSVAHRPPEVRGLVPAMVDGDESAVPPELATDFRTTGLTHLMAVSGTNLTLLLGFMLTVARWCGVRGRWIGVVGAAGIGAFILLARTEPSVLRAAAMGTVGLLALGSNGRGRALRGLGAAVLGLLLVDPRLGVSIGFALSTLATAGILLVGPLWRDALARWLPRWLAEAIAVPTAAQLACTPLIAAISGQVSLAAIGANLLAEPMVGPATILGLAGGLLGLVVGGLGRVVGTVASWCVAWIVYVAHHGAHLPTAAITWGTGGPALVALTMITAAVALHGPRLVASPRAGIVSGLVLVVVMLVRLPAPGWL